MELPVTIGRLYLQQQIKVVTVQGVIALNILKNRIMDSLHFELPVGLTLGEESYKEVELLSTNGIAEKVFLKKIPEKPFTWQANIVAIATKSIGPYEIGAETRKKYQEEGSVTIPHTVKALTMADVNTLLVEIHRRCWVSFIPKQEILCKYCGKKLIADIDLDKIDFLPETKEAMENRFSYTELVVNLKKGFRPPVIPKMTDKEEYRGLTDTVFNRFVFRPPLLQDALNHERYYSDSIGFWRRIAMDCLISVEKVDSEGKVVDRMPEEFHTYYGLKIFNEILVGEDLRLIRVALQEDLPTLPYAYFESCGCDEQREIPMVMDVSNFFSE